MRLTASPSCTICCWRKSSSFSCDSAASRRLFLTISYSSRVSSKSWREIKLFIIKRLVAFKFPLLFLHLEIEIGQVPLQRQAALLEKQARVAQVIDLLEQFGLAVHDVHQQRRVGKLEDFVSLFHR